MYRYVCVCMCLLAILKTAVNFAPVEDTHDENQVLDEKYEDENNLGDLKSKVLTDPAILNNTIAALKECDQEASAENFTLTDLNKFLCAAMKVFPERFEKADIDSEENNEAIPEHEIPPSE